MTLIEAEVIQAEETISAISTAMAKIIGRLNLTTSVEVTTSRSIPPPPSTDHHVEHTRESITCLPKLDLRHLLAIPFTGSPSGIASKPQ